MKEVNNRTVVDNFSLAAQTTVTREGVTYEWVKVAENFDIPLGVFHAGDGSGRLFVVEQGGNIWIVRDGEVLPQPFLTISDLPPGVPSGVYTEQGLLGLAFHPDYERTGVFFVSYTNRQGDSVLARYRVSAEDPDRADPSSAEILLTVDQPFEDHNGGNIVFGPDGYLYIGFGDGGRPAEPNYNSQEPQRYLGKMLRLDVNADTYRVPADNPFVDDPAYLSEIWALGLRNPWRFSFDRVTGDLYIGDVGQWRMRKSTISRGPARGARTTGGARLRRRIRTWRRDSPRYAYAAHSRVRARGRAVGHGGVRVRGPSHAGA